MRVRFAGYGVCRGAPVTDVLDHLHRLWLRFENNVAGELNVGARIRFEGMFAPLRDPAVFAQAFVHPELGTVVWPGGADLDPDVLYAAVTGTEIALQAMAAPRTA